MSFECVCCVKDMDEKRRIKKLQFYRYIRFILNKSKLIFFALRLQLHPHRVHMLFIAWMCRNKNRKWSRNKNKSDLMFAQFLEFNIACCSIILAFYGWPTICSWITHLNSHRDIWWLYREQNAIVELNIEYDGFEFYFEKNFEKCKKVSHKEN